MERCCLARRLADAHLAAHLRDLRSGLGLPEGVDDLLLGKLGCLHGDLAHWMAKIRSPDVYFLRIPYLKTSVKSNSFVKVIYKYKLNRHRVDKGTFWCDQLI
jgi:hypothetical protein